MALTPTPLDRGQPDAGGRPTQAARRGTARRGAVLAGVVAAIAIAVLAPDPSPTLRSAERFHDFLHVPGLALVAGLLLATFPASPGGKPRARAGRLAAVFVATVSVGVLIELLQAVLGGPVSLGDIGRDAGGAAAAVLVAASYAPGTREAGRRVLRVLAIALAAAFALPVAGALVEEWRARLQFPVLADFSRPEELERFEWTGATPGLPRAGRGRGLPLAMKPGRYPGFALTYFPGDWRGYRSFVFSAANPSGAPLPIVIRVDDQRHDGRYSDRFNARFELAPGRNEIRVPLAAVEAAPRGRRLDLSRVRQVVIFSYRLREPRELVIESLRLEK